jgi:hypothetical protein
VSRVLALLLLAPILAACETEPATDVGFSIATLNGRGECHTTQRVVYWYEYREVGTTPWSQTQHRTVTCAGDTGDVRLPPEKVLGLEQNTQYEYRVASKVGDGGTEYRDSAGSALLGNWDRFATRQAPVARAEPTRDLGDTIGVNTRTAYHGTTQDDYPRIRAALRYLGIRFIRDGLWPVSDTAQHEFYRELANTTDVKATMGGFDLRYGDAIVEQKLAILRKDATLRSFVESLENANEPDLSPHPYCDDGHDQDEDDRIDTGGLDSDGDGTVEPGEPQPDPQCESDTDEAEALAGHQDAPRWAQRMRSQARLLFERVNATPSLADTPVVGPSFAKGGFRLVGDLSESMDFGNMHPYRGNGAPGAGGSGMGPMFEQCAVTAGSKRCQATEVGYHTALNAPASEGNRPVDEATKAIYSLRMILEHYRLNLRRTDFYTLVDQFPRPGDTCPDLDEPEAQFGFYSCTWQPKPVAHAMHNFTSVMETNSSNTPPSLIRLGLDEAGPDVQKLAFHAGNGQVLVVLWRNVSLWDRNCPPRKRCPLDPGTDRVEVSLGARPWQVVRYNPNASDLPQETLTNPDRISVALSGDPVVLKVTL